MKWCVSLVLVLDKSINSDLEACFKTESMPPEQAILIIMQTELTVKGAHLASEYHFTASSST